MTKLKKRLKSSNTSKLKKIRFFNRHQGIAKGTIENLVNKIAQHTEPKIHPRITVMKAEGKEIIAIEVQPSEDKLVLANGRPYKRVGPSTR